MNATKRQYRREIKIEAVRRVEEGSSIHSIALELHVPEKLLQEWVANKKIGTSMRSQGRGTADK